MVHGMIVRSKKTGETAYKLGTVRVPCSIEVGGLSHLFDTSKRWNSATLQTMVAEMGLPWTPGVTTEQMWTVVMYDIQNAWLRATAGEVPENLLARQAHRIDVYRRQVVAAQDGKATHTVLLMDGRVELIVDDTPVDTSAERPRRPRLLLTGKTAPVKGDCPLEPGTALMTLWEKMKDGVAHPLRELQSYIDAEIRGRIRMLRVRGEQAKMWTVESDGETARMVSLKGGKA